MWSLDLLSSSYHALSCRVILHFSYVPRISLCDSSKTLSIFSRRSAGVRRTPLLLDPRKCDPLGSPWAAEGILQLGIDFAGIECFLLSGSTLPTVNLTQTAIRPANAFSQ